MTSRPSPGMPPQKGIRFPTARLPPRAAASSPSWMPPKATKSNSSSAQNKDMEFDWLDAPFDLHKVAPKEIEESFEDPFCLRLLPDGEIAGAGHARFVNLGKSIGGRGIFTIFWTD